MTMATPSKTQKSRRKQVWRRERVCVLLQLIIFLYKNRVEYFYNGTTIDVANLNELASH